MVGLQLQMEGSGLFPGAVENNGVDVRALRAVDAAFRRKIDIAGGTNGLVAVQDRQERRLTLLFIRNNGVQESLPDPADILLQAELAGILPSEVHLFGDVAADNFKDLGEKLVPRQPPCPRAPAHGGLLALADQGRDDLAGDLELNLLEMILCVELLPIVLHIFPDPAPTNAALQMVCHDPDECGRGSFLRLDNETLQFTELV